VRLATPSISNFSTRTRAHLTYLQDAVAYETYQDRLFLADTAAAPKLQSKIDNNEFLDSISGKGGKKKHKRGADDLVEISDESDEEEGDKPEVS
jgi:DNA-directed RNA polymerase-3 subunit RPC5